MVILHVRPFDNDAVICFHCISSRLMQIYGLNQCLIMRKRTVKLSVKVLGQATACGMYISTPLPLCDTKDVIKPNEHWSVQWHIA